MVTVVVAACGTDESPTVQPVTPLASLIFEGAEYTFSGYLIVATGEPTAFVIDGVDVNVAKLEAVGTTNKGNTSGLSERLQVYRSTVTGDANAVYTLRRDKAR